MKDKVRELKEDSKRMQEVLGQEKQAVWTCLRASFSHRLEYWLGLLHPSQVEEAARELDALYLEVLENICGSHLPKMGGSLTCRCCPMVEGLQLAIPGLPASSFQAHLYGQDLGEGRRWEPLLNSLSRTGQELAACLAKVKQEASALALYLGEEVSLYHSLEATGAGKGRTDGSTRHEMVKEIERLRAKALTKFLEEHPDQEARPVLVRKNCDKTSTAFLLARPGPHTGTHPVSLAEQLLALMAVPSGLCRGREGEKIGTLKVDIWGDNIMNCIVPGNDFIRGHNNLKNTLKSLLS